MEKKNKIEQPDDIKQDDLMGDSQESNYNAKGHKVTNKKKPNQKGKSNKTPKKLKGKLNKPEKVIKTTKESQLDQRDNAVGSSYPAKNRKSTSKPISTERPRTEDNQFFPVSYMDPEDDYRFDRLIRIMSNLVERNHIQYLENLLGRLRPSDISYISEFLGENEKAIIFSLLPHKEMAEILPEMSKQNRSAILQQRDPGWIAKMVDKMDSDDAADVLGELSAEQTSFILKKIDKADAEEIKKLLNYNENTAGGLMATEYLAVVEQATVTQVISEFKSLAENEDIEDLHTAFVIDKESHLVGHFPLRKLILYRGSTKVGQIMEKDIISVEVNDDQEEVAQIFKRHNLITAPVVDGQNVLVGRITIDDIVDVIDEEVSEDMYRMAGVGIESSINSTVRLNIRRRLPWLLVNLATAAISASVVSLFESTIEQLAILAAFMPIVAGLGGNAGAQVIAIAVRSIALGELTFTNAGKVLFREVFTGASNGLLLGLVIGGLTALITGRMFLGIIISWAMVMNVFTASIAGLVIPLALKRLGVDPAVASNIFVTPMTDTLGFFFFLGLAQIFMQYL